MWTWLRRRFGRARGVAPAGDAPVVCTCPCHQNPAIVHVMACCQPCPVCGQRFARGLPEHLRQAHGTLT